MFCDHYGLGLNAGNTEVILCKESLQNPSYPLRVGRAVLLIERKRTCSVGEVGVYITHFYVCLALCSPCNLSLEG